MRLSPLILLLVLVPTISPCQAKQPPASSKQVDPCKLKENAELQECANEANFARQKRAEAELARLIVKADLKSSNAQRAWVRYRQLECEEEGQPYQGGSIQASIVAACWTDLTNQRIKTIKGSVSYMVNQDQK